ncbi:hypothetical protein KL910_001800 [Ogataea haglerorum]|nr:hypothetical protein KL910_001800 [Ogataea haglerorum]KAG7792419.1 hypothetical protein KL945_000700 [Ogataea haglerorum]
MSHLASRAEDDFFAFSDEPIAPPKKKRKKKDKRPKTESLSVDIVADEPEKGVKEFTKEESAKSESPSSKAQYDTLIEELGLQAVEENVRKSASVKMRKVKAIETNNDDQFLKELDKDIELTQPDGELDEILQKYSSSEQMVAFNGRQIPIKQALFALTVEVALEDDEQIGFHLRVRSNAQFKTILREILKQLELHNRNLPPGWTEDIESLVFYVQDHDIILTQDLRVGSLLLSGARLPLSDAGDAFAITAVLTQEVTARRQRREASLEKLAQSQDHTEDLDDDELIITILDPQKDNERTSLSAEKGATVKELLDIFLVRMNYPDSLNIELQHDGLVLDKTIPVDFQLRNNDIVEVVYNLEDLESFGEHEVTVISDEDVMESEQSDYFSIKLKGKDQQEVRAQVNPKTKIRTIAEFYLSKVGLDPNTRIRLIFDCEELDLNANVEHTELDDGYLVDVELL